VRADGHPPVVWSRLVKGREACWAFAESPAVELVSTRLAPAGAGPYGYLYVLMRKSRIA